MGAPVDPTRPCPACRRTARPRVYADGSFAPEWSCSTGHRFTIGNPDPRRCRCPTGPFGPRRKAAECPLTPVGPFLVCAAHDTVVWPNDESCPVELCPTGQDIWARVLASFSLVPILHEGPRDDEVPFGYTAEEWAAARPEPAAAPPPPEPEPEPEPEPVVTLPADDAAVAVTFRPSAPEPRLFPVASVPVEVKRKTIGALSPSSASTLSQCPRRFELSKVLGRPEPTGRPATLGKFVHKVLELLTALPLAERTEDAARGIAGRLWADVEREPGDPLGYPEADGSGGDVDELRRDRVALRRDVADVADWIKHFKGESWAALAYAVSIEEAYCGEVAYRELKLWDSTVAGVPFRGYADRVDRHRSQEGLIVTDYKGLPLDTPLPTPTGWTTMGAVEVGDALIGSDGRPCRVMATSDVHHRPCLRLRFADGSTMVCDDEHLWSVRVRPRRAMWAARSALATKTLSAAELADLWPTHHLSIDNAAPLDTPDVDLPLDPWLLGAWLGDGKATAGEITVGDQDVGAMLDELDRVGEAWSIRPENTGSVQVVVHRPDPARCLYGHAEGFYRKTPNDRGSHGDCRRCSHGGWPGPDAFPANAALRGRLAALGVLGAKHVPDAYLRASPAQRLALLQGLMDTDGSWNPQRGQAVFVTTTRALAGAAYELVCSLGWRASWFEKDYRAKAGARTVHMIGFVPDKPVFRLARKAALQAADPPRNRRSAYRDIRRVEPVDTVPTRCVVVDSPDSTYLCGRQMVPTHNTGKAPLDKRSGLIDREKLDEKAEQLLWYWEAIETRTGERVVGAVLAYIGYAGQVVLWVDDARRAQAEAKLQRLWRDLGRFEAAAVTRDVPYPATTGYLCGWCPHFEDCAPGSRFLLDEWDWMERRTLRGEPVPAKAAIDGWGRERRQRWLAETQAAS